MSKTVIEVQELSKLYSLNEEPHSIQEFWEHWWRKKSGSGKIRKEVRLERSALFSPEQAGPSPDTFWALKDVTFNVEQGEVVGVIGRNGAGKSTLLKILSKITQPTSGRARIRGRMASLLEIGTGFHGDLTGRENIFLNGTILGMRKQEIAGLFDEIVAFSGIEGFLDTPVKYYSSGMYVRLAFSVAAHLNPEILIVDEVLAVGDAEFQNKCLGKLSQVTRDGRTVLFVSHNVNAVQRLCQKCLLLKHGKVQFWGEMKTAVDLYLSPGLEQMSGTVDLSLSSGKARRGNGAARFIRAELFNSQNQTSAEFAFGEPMRVKMTVQSKMAMKNAIVGFSFISQDGVEVQGTCAHDGGAASDLSGGEQVFECRVDPLLLTPGWYSLRAAIFRAGEEFDYIDQILNFRVLNANKDLSKTPAHHYVGHVYYPYRWTS